MPSHTERKSGEELLGSALRGKRQDVIVTSEVGEKRCDGENGGGLSRRHTMRAMDGTLRRLQTDCVDLYYTYWPDPNTPPEETLQTMGDLVRAGKIRYFSLSSSPGWEVAEAVLKGQALGAAVPICNQVPYSQLRRQVESEVIPACEHFGLSVLPYRPLYGGILSGTENTRRRIAVNQRWRGAKGPGYSAAEIAVAEKMDALAAAGEYAASQLAMAWLLAKPQVSSATVGTSRPASLEEAVDSLNVRLTDELLIEVDLVRQIV